MGVIQELYPNDKHKDKEKKLKPQANTLQDTTRSTTPGRWTRPPVRTPLAALALSILAWVVLAGVVSGVASAQDTTVTFDATMAGPTTGVPAAGTSTGYSTPAPAQTTVTSDSTDAYTTAYPPQTDGADSTMAEPQTVSPSTTATTVEQTPLTTPVATTTRYAGTTSVGYPALPNNQLMSTGGFALRPVIAGTALALIAGASLLYVAAKARRRPGGHS